MSGDKKGGRNSSVRMAQTKDDDGLIRNIILCDSKLGRNKNPSNSSSSAPSLDWTYTRENTNKNTTTNNMNNNNTGYGAGSRNSAINNSDGYNYDGSGYRDGERPVFKSMVTSSVAIHKKYNDTPQHPFELTMQVKGPNNVTEKSVFEKNKEYIKQLQAKKAASLANSNERIEKGDKSLERPIYIPKYMKNPKKEGNNDMSNANNTNNHNKFTSENEPIDDDLKFLDNVDKFLDKININVEEGLLDALEETKKRIDNKIQEIKAGSSQAGVNVGESPFEDVQVAQDVTSTVAAANTALPEDENALQNDVVQDPTKMTNEEIIDSILSSVPPEERVALYVNG